MSADVQPVSAHVPRYACVLPLPVPIAGTVMLRGPGGILRRGQVDHHTADGRIARAGRGVRVRLKDNAGECFLGRTCRLRRVNGTNWGVLCIPKRNTAL